MVGMKNYHWVCRIDGVKASGVGISMDDALSSAMCYVDRFNAEDYDITISTAY